MDRLLVGVFNVQGQGYQTAAEDLFRGQGILADDDPGSTAGSPDIGTGKAEGLLGGEFLPRAVAVFQGEGQGIHGGVGPVQAQGQVQGAALPAGQGFQISYRGGVEGEDIVPPVQGQPDILGFLVPPVDQGKGKEKFPARG